VKQATTTEKILVLGASWLIPGFGFYRHGLRKHAIFFFVVLQATFLFGAALQGSVLFPEFRFRSEGFNLVAILTFLTQMFNGLVAMISLLPDMAGPRFAILPYNETHWAADLGSFFMLVSGGMNWFVIASTYDHFYGRRSRERTPQKEVAAA
jgi:hypothetical protein